MRRSLKSQVLLVSILVLVAMMMGCAGGGPPIKYTVTLSVQGGGTITPSPGDHLISSGTIILLEPQADVGWVFAGWGGIDGTFVPEDNYIVVQRDMEIVATFVELTYSLVPTVTPANSGRVELADIGTEGGFQKLRITAVPNSGFAFERWDGDVLGTDNQTFVTMDGNKSVTAVFIDKVATPSIDSDADTNQVTITCQTAEATIFYTTDGSAPSEDNGTEYSGPFVLDRTTVVRAIAFADGLPESDVADLEILIAWSTLYSLVRYGS